MQQIQYVPKPTPLTTPPVTAVSPQFTAEAYTTRTGRPCSPLSFQDIASGLLPELLMAPHHTQPEPEQPEPERPEPEQPEPEQPEPERPKPEQPEPEQPELEQPELEQPEPEHSTFGQGSGEVDDKEDTKPNPGSFLDMIICSFALHLLEDSSQLWALLSELSWKATWLIILEPHKKPEVSCSPAILRFLSRANWKCLDQGGLGLDAMEFPRMEG